MPRLKTGAINKHVSIRPAAVIGYDPVHLPHSDVGCVTVSKRKQVTGALATFFSPATDAQWWLARASDGSGGKLVGLMELPQGQPNCNYRP